jgi:hypothetical protein
LSHINSEQIERPACKKNKYIYLLINKNFQISNNFVSCRS